MDDYRHYRNHIQYDGQIKLLLHDLAEFAVAQCPLDQSDALEMIGQTVARLREMFDKQMPRSPLLIEELLGGWQAEYLFLLSASRRNWERDRSIAEGRTLLPLCDCGEESCWRLAPVQPGDFTKGPSVDVDAPTDDAADDPCAEQRL